MVNNIHIIMPVKDSLTTAEQSIRAIVDSGHTLTIYDDISTEKNAHLLDQLAEELHFEVIHISQQTDHPSPNYRWVLIDAQEKALRDICHLVIIESDVTVGSDTIDKMVATVKKDTGMVAAITHDEQDAINFPYQYAQGKMERKNDGQTIETEKRFSFCCTLLSNALLNALDFNDLDSTKDWYDVTITHQSTELGFRNLLMFDNPVIHRPHSSRPWKLLKYSNPLLYYWRKLTQQKDKI